MSQATSNSSSPKGLTGYYDSEGRSITRAAFFAIKAARLRPQVGRHMATAHALKNGSTPRLVRLAYQLQAALDADLRTLRGLDFTANR